MIYGLSANIPSHTYMHTVVVLWPVSAACCVCTVLYSINRTVLHFLSLSAYKSLHYSTSLFIFLHTSLLLFLLNCHFILFLNPSITCCHSFPRLSPYFSFYFCPPALFLSNHLPPVSYCVWDVHRWVSLLSCRYCPNLSTAGTATLHVVFSEQPPFSVSLSLYFLMLWILEHAVKHWSRASLVMVRVWLVHVWCAPLCKVCELHLCELHFGCG